MRSAIALAYSPTSLGVTYVPASPADTRVSRRSKATTGSSKAMYSIVLFIVDTSFRGFFGSGDSPTAELEHEDVGGPYDDINAVLGSHDADVRGEEPPAPAKFWACLPTLQSLRVRSSAHDRDVRRQLAPSHHGDAPVRIVGGDHVVRSSECPSLQCQEHPVGQARASRETR